MSFGGVAVSGVEESRVDNGTQDRLLGALYEKASVMPLKLTSPPTTEDLVAAGQLGGPLFPTHEMKDARRQKASHLSFGEAMEAWNKHEYRKAVGMLRKHVEEFPDSPWAAEAELHIGCDATYNGRYTEAEALFNKLIMEQQGKDHAGAKMLLGKARERLALLKVEQRNLDQAGILFTALLESPDWRHRTYASHWIQRLSHLTAAKQALLTCGADALAYVLQKEGRGESAAMVRTNVPSTMRGHSLADLVRLSVANGYQLSAIEISPAELSRLPLPAILRVGSKTPGDIGHYWVLDRITRDQLELFDPQSGRRFEQTAAELACEWSGRALVFTKEDSLPGRKLDLRELENDSGGCCGAKAPPNNLGNSDNNVPKDRDCKNGAPIWQVNVVNMNLFVTDTPLWYNPPVGPPVGITLSYNSQSSITHNEPFGNKWMFNYGSYITVDTSGSVLVYMPDGRYDLFSPDGAGGYQKPYQVHNTLTKWAENYFELRFPDDTVYIYDIPYGTDSQQPFLTEIRDAHDHWLSFDYDGDVRLTSIVNEEGKRFTLTYNAAGLCTNVADPFGRNARFEYDANRNLTKITDMGGYWSGFTYDANVYLTSVSNERGTWGFWIEPSGPAGNSDNYPPPGDPNTWANYRITITDPLGQREEYFYYGGCDQDGEYGCSGQTWHVSARDYIPWQSQAINNYRSRAPKTRYLFTHAGSGQYGEISKILRPEGDYILYGYDSVTGDRTSVTDASGHTWRYTFNSVGRVTSVTDARANLTAFLYAMNGVDLLSISNGLGYICLTYNDQHDLVSLNDRLNHATTFAYNADGQIAQQVDALGITNEYVYDASRRLTEFRRAGQILERFSYDTVDRVRTLTDAMGLTVTNSYNNLNQIVRVTYLDGRSESYSYSTCCPRMLDSVTDRGGRTTFFVHDAIKRLIQATNPEGGITQLNYDANGNRTSLTDPNGNVTTFAYDLDNRLIRKTYADGKGVSFGYGPDGLLATRTNGRGIITSYTYDANHKLLTTRYSDGTPGVTNTYDPFNRLVVVKDGIGTTIHGYDANSRPISFDGPWANDSITYAFDPLGRRTNLLVQGSQPTGYDYDALDRLKNVRVGAQTYAYTYAGVNPLVRRLDRPNGSFTTYQYDGLSRLTALSNRRSTGEVLNEFLYTYNAQDLRVSETASNGPSFTLTNQQIAYEYNRLNQVVTSALPNQVFAYDDDGNMTRGLTVDGRTFLATYDANNRCNTLSYVDGSGVSWLYEIKYSAAGYAVQTDERRNGTLTHSTRYIRHGALTVQERDGLNQVFRQYAWGKHNGGGIGGLLSMTQGSQQYSHLFDGRGNVTAVLDSSQVVAARYTYDPFGAIVFSDGNLEQPYKFATKPNDILNGIYNFGFRYYDTVGGRWLSRDPLGETLGMSTYGYVRNNPMDFLDPFGLRDRLGQEVQSLLDKARADAQAGPVRGLLNLLRNHQGIGPYDFKINNPEDRFCVNGRWMTAGEFGNYIAGYAAESYGPVAVWGMYVGGILYDATDGGPTYLDNDGSRDFINEGVRDADRQNGSTGESSFVERGPRGFF